MYNTCLTFMICMICVMYSMTPYNTGKVRVVRVHITRHFKLFFLWLRPRVCDCISRTDIVSWQPILPCTR